MRAGLVAIVVAGALANAAPAMAQDRPLIVSPYGPAGNAGDGYGLGYPGVPVDALPTPFSHGGSCVKLCQFDQAPCDPEYWKVADRRCNYNQRG